MLGTQQLGSGLQLGGGLPGLGGQQASQAGGLRLGTGLGLGQPTGGGLSLGGGAGLGQQGTGLGLGQSGTGMGLPLGGGLGLGQQQQGTGTGLSLGGLNLGQQPQTGTGMGLRLGGGGLGTGTQPIATRPIGLGLGAGGGGGGTLGGLNLAGTQRGTSTGLGTGIFSLPSQQQQYQQQLAVHQAVRAQLMLNAVKSPGVFPDERDMAVMKFNLLQAYCGTGRGLASYQGQTQLVDFTSDNPFCRFKTVCYSRLPTARNEDGLVVLQFNKSDANLLSQQDSIVKSLQDIVGNPNVHVMVDSIRPLPDSCSEMTIYILERSVLGGTRPLLAADVYMFLQNASRKAQLEKLGMTGLYPKTGITEENLKLYLQTPPAGLNPQLWEQSKKDNPNPQKFIPVPVVGSSALLKRMKHQEQECKQHQSRLEIMRDEILELQSCHATTMAKMAEYRRNLIHLSHRVLKVMVAQETLRKSGYAVQQDEEQLRIRLESIQAELDAPLQFKGRLNELMSQIRMQTQVPGARAEPKLSMDPVLMDEIQQHLQQQQGALSQLVTIIKEDFEDLKCIEEGFSQT